jgi:hypothetical protein
MSLRAAMRPGVRHEGSRRQRSARRAPLQAAVGREVSRAETEDAGSDRRARSKPAIPLRNGASPGRPSTDSLPSRPDESPLADQGVEPAAPASEPPAPASAPAAPASEPPEPASEPPAPASAPAAPAPEPPAPASAPAAPASEPPAPASAPAAPASEPPAPASAPAPPASEPPAPASEPPAPASAPAAPASDPAAPASEPPAPASEPAAPAVEPAAPAVVPADPAVEPAAPDELPALPADDPAEPATLPAAPLAPAVAGGLAGASSSSLQALMETAKSPRTTAPRPRERRERVMSHLLKTTKGELPPTPLTTRNVEDVPS